jgi:transposase
LEEWFRCTQDRQLRDRLQIVLMAHRGRARQDLAADLGIHRSGVTRWLNAYGQSGLHGLLPKKATGQAANIPDALAEPIRQGVIGGPAAQSRDRANGTHEELADPLHKTHGIKTWRRALQRFCSKSNLRLDRPTDRFRRADAAKQEAAQEDRAGLKKSAGRRIGVAQPGGGAVPDGPPPWRPRWVSRGTARWWARAPARTCCTSSPS